MARAVAIHAKATQGDELRAQTPATPLAPTDRLPIAQRLRAQHFIGALDLSLPTATEGDAEVGAHGADILPATILQSVEEIGIVTVIAIRDDAGLVDPTRICFIEQIECDFSFGLKSDLRRHVGFGTPCWVISPLTRQVEARCNRPSYSPFSVNTIDSHLTMGHFADRAGILPRYPDRVVAFLLKATIIKQQHAIAFAWQFQHASKALPVERFFVPYPLCQQMIELLLGGFGDHFGQSFTGFLRMLAEQAGQRLPQSLSAGSITRFFTVS